MEELRRELINAVKNNKLDQVKALLENGTVPATIIGRESNIIKWTLAEEAAVAGHLEVLKYLVKKEPSLLRKKPEEEYGAYQQGPLELACEYGHLDIVKYLVEECNMDIFEERLRQNDDFNAINPIHTAARYGRVEILKYLIKKGNVDVNAPIRQRKDAPKDIKYPKSLLHLADVYGYDQPKVLDYLLKETNIDVSGSAGNETSILFMKNIISNIPMLKFILDKHGDKFDINEKSEKGHTLLHHFTGTGDLNTVQFLVEKKGANITIQDDEYKWTPLHFAAAQSRPRMGIYLINRGASIDPTDKDGDTPLHLTAIAGYVNMCKVLIKHGANINQRNREGDSPLHYAINGHYEKKVPRTQAFHCEIWSFYKSRNAPQVFVHLVNCGANITQKNNGGKTPIDYLIAKGDLKGLKYLIRKGIIDVNKVNENRESLVHLAVIYNQVPILDYLVRKKHADIETARLARSTRILGCYNTDTPLETALNMKHYESSKYLIKHGAKNPDIRDVSKEGEEMYLRIEYELHSRRARRSIVPQSLSINLQNQSLHKFNDHGSSVLEEANHSIEGVADPFFSTITHRASQFCGFLSLTHLLVSYIHGSAHQREPTLLEEGPEDINIEEAVHTLPDFEGIR